MRIESMYKTSINKIDAGIMGFWAVVNESEGDNSGLRLLERQWVKMWLKRAFAEIAGAGV